MRSDPEFDALLRQLLHSGVAPKYVARLTAELQEHYDDLQQEARRAGVPPELVAADARERLGQSSAIADEFRKHPELLSWIDTSAWLAALLRAVAGGYVALCTPIRALAAGPDALMRYAAAGAAGAAVTTVLLLSMVVALSPGSRAVQAVSSALRVPVEALQPPHRAEDAPAASSRSRSSTGPRTVPRNVPPESMVAREPSGALESERAGAADGRGAGPQPIYEDLLRTEMPRPSIRPDPQEPALLAFGFEDFQVAPIDARAAPEADAAASAPKPIVGALPNYPRVAARLGLEGHVVVEYTVSRLGRAEDVVIVESSHDLFHRAALNAAREFRFAPRVVGGQPVEVRGVRTTVRFLLER